MFGVQFSAALEAATRPPGADSVASPSARRRRLALLASGRRRGPITRLITPWSIGELTTPFVFLAYAEAAPHAQPVFGVQPHSSIAALTVVLSGEVSFEDTTGGHGEVSSGGVGWMKAAHAVWRSGGCASGEPLRMFQLWIALPPSQEGSPAASESIALPEVEEDGPVRVILGQFGRARSHIRSAPPDITCLHVRLTDGQHWRYTAPDGHNVTWLAVDRGGLHLQEGERVYWEQIAVFGDSAGVIEAQADGETSFVLASAKRDARPLALANGSIHTRPASLARGKAESAWIARRLRAHGRR
jgi:redox-sensitive bicupin YhaK (pirin superfamily)